MSDNQNTDAGGCGIGRIHRCLFRVPRSKLPATASGTLDAYVSPLKHKDYDCDQIAMKMDYVGQRTTRLHARLKKKSDNDSAQMGIGLVLFLPALFFLEGGDGLEAAEYSQLKDEYGASKD